LEFQDDKQITDDIPNSRQQEAAFMTGQMGIKEQAKMPRVIGIVNHKAP